MNSHRSVLHAVLKGALVLAVYWMTAFVLVQFGQRVAGGWAFSQLGEVLAGAVGVFLALRLNVKPVAYVLGGLLAFSVSELVLHSIFGNRSVQGGPTHFAVMLAGILGIALGAFLRTREATPNAEHEEAGTALVGDAA
ncbi:MAG TPA: hypothetical protein VGQ65_20010 [Thermoanaerobaculia bacterium]|jgi:hypothetical protein|nr:hypothetical protein [Thermoanaerobaculia bacterium]